MSNLICSHTRYDGQLFTDLSLEGRQFDSSQFYDCAFIRCSFVETVFSGCRFFDCTFEQSDLSLAQLPNSLFSGTGFEESKLIGIDWTRAEWPSLRLHVPISFSKCVLNHSTFIGLELETVKILDCIVKDVDFRETNLSRASFAGTDLSASLFLNTNLTEADLSRAYNYQIGAGENVLARAKFSLPEAVSLLNGLGIVLVEGGEK